MTNYITDRMYTDYIHENVAIPTVYKKLGWEELKVDPTQLNDLDVKHGVDYIFRDEKGLLHTVQERFRERKYYRYSDFTIRYRRDYNSHKDRVESEYYKLNANYFTYGITNCSKYDLSLCTEFQKVAIVDLQKVYDKIDKGLIVIRNNGARVCSIEDGKIICPVIENHDHSSSFFPIEISYLVDLWGEDMVLFKKGF
ncbi:MAG: hypothetical protein LKF70_11300 [Prevotella sp.]|jgi:hypothetical protein|nr:hypothetical protein [Prevotella sp.]